MFMPLVRSRALQTVTIRPVLSKSYGKWRAFASVVSSQYNIESLTRAVPKADIHVHLDGSIRLETVLELIRSNLEYARTVLPPLACFPKLQIEEWTTDMLLQDVFKQQYASLPDYLMSFVFSDTAMNASFEGLERIGYEYVQDCIADNVFYTEVRFAPQLHWCRDGWDAVTVLRHVNNGMRMAANEHNHSARGAHCRFEYGIIVCAMRAFTRQFGFYFNHLFDVMDGASEADIYGMAAVDVTHAALKARDQFAVPIVAIDIAGAERGYPAAWFQEAYDVAHAGLLRCVAHAGEDAGPESIKEALCKLHVERIGHGYTLFSPEKIEDPSVGDTELHRKKYCADLVEYIRNRDITIEVCLSSNLQTKVCENLASHNYRHMLDAGLQVAISTDSTLVSHTTRSKELQLAVDHYPEMTTEQFRGLVLNGLLGSFCDARTKTQMHAVYNQRMDKALAANILLQR